MADVVEPNGNAAKPSKEAKLLRLGVIYHCRNSFIGDASLVSKVTPQKMMLLAATIVVLIGAGYWLHGFYERHLTAGERKAALRAVYSIDGMVAPDITKSVYAQRESKAQKALADAHVEARTSRDRLVFSIVEKYFGMAQDAHGMALQSEALQAIAERSGYAFPAESRSASDASLSASNSSLNAKSVAALFRADAMKLLDQTSW